tara:strand:+ start:400 stop:717 length:318 start_codon:yes stop_codon:yes gene_type:complete
MINKKYMDSMNKKMSQGRMGLFDDGGLFYSGEKSNYDNCTRSKFTESLGEDKLGEILGHIEVEVWDNDGFSLEISDSSQVLIHLEDFDIRILKKLRDYLNYAVAE